MGDTPAGALSAARELLRHLPSLTASPGAMRQWRDDVDRLLGVAHSGSIRPRPRSSWRRHEASTPERTSSMRTAPTGDLRIEMAMGKYPPGVTTPYPYPRHKNNLIGSPIYISGYEFTPILIPMWVWVTHRVTRTHKNYISIKILYYTNVNYIHLNTITKFLASFNHLFNTPKIIG
jgi:hypothetical protein